MGTKLAALILAAATLLGVSSAQTAGSASTKPSQAKAPQAMSSQAQATQTKDIDISYTRFVLDNGLTVIVHEDHKAPIVAINMWYHVGSKNEKLGKTGFAHLFEHLMFGGSEHSAGRYIDDDGEDWRDGSEWDDQ